jgi:hypothetical protein
MEYFGPIVINDVFLVSRNMRIYFYLLILSAFENDAKEFLFPYKYINSISIV